MKSNRTKGKILDTSIRLFNEKKASNVSTVQISAAMEISPGNLYYYYANKEEVIRCIWQERMAGEINDLTEQYEGMETAEELLGFFSGMMQHCLRYKFFYTEMPTLFVNDNTLIALYEEVNDGVTQAAADMYRSLMSKKKVRAIPEDDIMYAAENSITLIIGLMAQYDLMSLKRVEAGETSDVIWKRILGYLDPYLEDGMRAEMKEALSARESGQL